MREMKKTMKHLLVFAVVHICIPSLFAASSFCTNAPPGMPLFQYGYDLTDLDILHDTGMNVKRPVLDITCVDPSKTYVNPYNSKSYQLPDQLDGQPLNVDGTMKQALSILANSSETFSEAVAETISESFFFGLFSSSETLSEIAQAMVTESAYVGLRTSEMVAYKMNLHESFRVDVMNLTADCQYLVDHLPVEFNESTVDAYEQLIGECGTDYLQEATLGCSFHYRHLTGAVRACTMAEGDIDANAGIDFLGFLSKSGVISGNVSAAAKGYLNITSSHTSCRGAADTGCPSDQTAYHDWLAACPSQPALLRGSFSSIGHLIRDPSRAASFELARTNHFNVAFLRGTVVPLLDALLAVLQSGVLLRPSEQCFNFSTDVPIRPNMCLCPNASNVECAVWKSVSCGDFQIDTKMYQCVITNLTRWTTEITKLKTQSKSLITSNYASNSSIALLGLEFLEDISKVRLPLVNMFEHYCGYSPITGVANLSLFEFSCMGFLLDGCHIYHENK